MRRLLEHNNADLMKMRFGSAVAEVERAIEMRTIARKKDAAYNEVWCAFNRADRTDLDAARELADSKGIGIAICDPNVELWFLLHFEDVEGALDQADVARRLAPHFDKDLSSLRHQENRLFGKYDVARERALLVGDAGQGSNLHDLVDSMRASKRAFSGRGELPKL